MNESLTRAKEALGSRMKEFFGVFADIVGVLAAFNFLPVFSGAWGLAIGIFAFLVGLILAIMLLSTATNTVAKALVWALLIFSLAGLAFLIPTMMIRIFAERPSSAGTVLKQTSELCRISTAKTPNGLEGNCPLNFDHDADSVDIIFSVTGEQRSRVKEVMVDVTGSGGDVADLVLNDPKEAGVLISNFSVPSRLTAKVSITVEQNEPQAPIELQVSYQYRTMGWWWRVTKWIFERYP
jgi:hypothetical protein